MDIVGLLGQKLKSDSIIELFEMYSVNVIYDYDRLNENIPDSYSASIDEIGLVFSFNSEQRLTTIFIKSDLPITGIIRFNDIEEIEKYCDDNTLTFKKGEVEFLGILRKWVKVFYQTYSVHYEFHGSILYMVTLEVIGA